MTRRSTPPRLPAPFSRGGFTVRFAESARDLHRAQELRHLCFVDAAGRPARPDARDADQFDPLCDHVLVEAAGRLVCTFRLMPYANGAEARGGYTAGHYDLRALADHPGPMVELGRFCIAPGGEGADLLRVAWGMIAAYVDGIDAALLFGCSSFAGTDPQPYGAAFDLLAARHLAPVPWRVGRGARPAVAFADSAAPVSDHRRALGQVPPLLRSYLTMGGWVSDHAVIDHEMNTLHVFTGLQISAIPPARARALRAIAAEAGAG
ncbi:GNAT family N-acetyltransferase [Thalassorhabdomicrobium marinisediminis]|uniref:GNAT family N-acetyltransferase n=1 Tax=Thalassorhabdomicrobium marinisediminis TaxID=2170577 RepID=UPI002492A9B6|nr:GNAT family N-acetyltransferase [Thalassorhabdomicrobium marinisediminis]